jgi:hypothetical protein
MNEFKPLRHYELGALSVGAIIMSFLASAYSLPSVGIIWGGYLVVYVFANAIRQGARSLGWPLLAFLTLAVVCGSRIGEQLLPFGLLAVLAAAIGLAIRFTSSRASQFRAAREARKGPFQPVTGSTARSATEIDAGAILADLGLNEEVTS